MRFALALITALTIHGTAAAATDWKPPRTLEAATIRPPQARCGIKVVSHRFVGAPNTRITFAGGEYVIPERGWIELIANRRTDTYRVHDQTLKLKVGSLDQFGAETVHVPAGPIAN